MQDDSTFNVKKFQKLRLEHFGSYSSFSYCTHSSVYRVSWPSGWVVGCSILILLRHSFTGPEHPIYRTMQYIELCVQYEKL